MPTLYSIKPAFQNLLRPLVGRLVAAGATANQITVAALALSVFAGAIIALYPETTPLFLDSAPGAVCSDGAQCH
ncbi:hypothetical protein [Phyllobacterium sp. A18/5-2]|uniref:hypothetical protein n=1 Tax=Phyllobacterium sp. A18/5-2 TaxID=2978392 RepID=UPI0029056994|nr:hypothetical protein [Phyllobacterium sp. A18/5-2]